MNILNNDLMLNDLTCKICNEITLSKDNLYEFTHPYKGFADLLGCNLVTCLNCGQDIQDVNNKIIEKTKTEYEEYVDSLIDRFFLYSEVNIGRLFKHHRKGTIYKLVLIANLESSDQTKFPTIAVYEDTELGLIWARPLEEFIKNFILQG